jgi:hypothetical protein
MRYWAILICGSVLWGTTVAAQSTQATLSDWQPGFRAAVGLGVGSAGISCDGCGSDRDNSVSGILRFGGGIRPGVVLGGQVTSWAKNVHGGTESLTFVTFVTQWYPQPRQGFFVLGGLGVAAMDATGDGVELRTNSLGLQAGVGYDITLTRKFAITPYADLLYGTGGNVQVNGSTTNVKVSSNLVQFGVAASWR